MRLREYLRRNDFTVAELAFAVGASVHGVGKWVRGDRIPRRETMRRIKEATGGHVTADDFLSHRLERAA